jgi:AraC-like DNA-binding protein
MVDNDKNYGSFDTVSFRELNKEYIGCYIFLVTYGSAIILVNGKKKLVKGDTLTILFYDDEWTILNSTKQFNGLFVKLNYDEIDDAIFRISSNSFWNFLLHNSILYPDLMSIKLLNAWFDSIAWINEQTDISVKSELLKSSVYTLFLAINVELEKQTISVKNFNRNQSWILGLKFLNLLTIYKREERSVQFYAEKMNITTTYLNKITHKVLHLSPKELIDQQVISEIKHYLLDTNLTLKEIAEKFNFEDVSYLSRIFKKQTGMTTKQFRNRQ